jgi:recombination protein RecA
VTEQDRQRTIRLKLARQESRDFGVLPTGFASLDAALGAGGFPRTRLTELFGPAGCGKTTLALQAAAHAQQCGFTAAWIDAEHVFDAAYAARLGVSLERLPLAQPASAEQAMEIVRRLAASGAVDLVVIDSAAALVPSLELETGLSDSRGGLQSRVLASGLRKLAAAVARTSTSVVFLNQARSRPQASGGEAETSAGGPPLKLYAAVRIALAPAGQNRVRFRILKNKVGEPFAEGYLAWSRGGGFAKSP